MSTCSGCGAEIPNGQPICVRCSELSDKTITFIARRPQAALPFIAPPAPPMACPEPPASPLESLLRVAGANAGLLMIFLMFFSAAGAIISYHYAVVAPLEQRLQMTEAELAARQSNLARPVLSSVGSNTDDVNRRGMTVR